MTTQLLGLHTPAHILTPSGAPGLPIGARGGYVYGCVAGCAVAGDNAAEEEDDEEDEDGTGGGGVGSRENASPRSTKCWCAASMLGKRWALMLSLRICWPSRAAPGSGAYCGSMLFTTAGEPTATQPAGSGFNTRLPAPTCRDNGVRVVRW